MEAPPWHDEIRDRLLRALDDGTEAGLRRYASVLLFLDRENDKRSGDDKLPYSPHWLSLKSSLNNDRAFEAYAKRLAEMESGVEDEAEDDDVDVDPSPGSFRICSLPNVLSKSRKGYICESMKKAGMIGVTQAITMMTCEDRALLTDLIPASSFIGDLPVITFAESMLNLVDESRGRVVILGLLIGNFGYSSFGSLKERRDGNVSNKVFASQICENLFSSIGCVAGGYVGAFYGKSGGPLCCLIGGLVGATALCVVGGSGTFHVRRYFFPGD